MGTMVDSWLTIQEDDFAPTPRVSVENHRRSLAFSFSRLLIVDALSPRAFLYRKLPSEPLKLSVLKLDGSCFGNSLSLLCFSNCFFFLFLRGLFGLQENWWMCKMCFGLFWFLKLLDSIKRPSVSVMWNFLVQDLSFYS